MQRQPAKMFKLFTSMLTLSAFTFGGGFVIVSLMKKKFVEDLGWLGEDEMLDITAIAQSAPGPIMVNAAVILGYRVAGLAGAFTAALASALPPLVIISVISVFYTQFRENRYIAIALQVMRAGVAAVIFDVVINLTKNVCRTRRALYIALMLCAFVATVFLNVSAMSIILCCLAIGLCEALVVYLRGRKGDGTHAA